VRTTPGRLAGGVVAGVGAVLTTVVVNTARGAAAA
jgi:hypothetical protein